MNKKFILYFFIVIGVASIPGTFFALKKHFTKNVPQKITQTCPQETKVCPDGTTVARVGTDCGFVMCPVEDISPSQIEMKEVTQATSTETGSTSPVQIHTTPKVTQATPVKTPTLVTPKKSSNPITTIVSMISATVNNFSVAFNINQSGNPNDANIPASTYIPSTNQENVVYKPLPPKNFAGEKYLVKDGNILSNDNKVIYTLPPEVINSVISTNAGWTNHTINVVPVGTVPPLVNAIPITDLPGKYYLSENSFGNIEACEFSNKIFILDTYANTVQLMYEENSSTLKPEDPRACNSEIFLLATEANKLILKYHTIGTNTLCDSAWSEPNKTWYLTVDKLHEKMTIYPIPETLYFKSEDEEAACRAKL